MTPIFSITRVSLLCFFECPRIPWKKFFPCSCLYLSKTIHLDSTALAKNQPHKSHSMISFTLKSWPTASALCPVPELSSRSFQSQFSKTRELKRIQELNIRRWQKWPVLGRVDIHRGLENLLRNTFSTLLCKKLFNIPVLPLGGTPCCFKELSRVAASQLSFNSYLLTVNYCYYFLPSVIPCP